MMGTRHRMTGMSGDFKRNDRAGQLRQPFYFSFSTGHFSFVIGSASNLMA
jgi:hypothetical protein